MVGGIHLGSQASRVAQDLLLLLEQLVVPGLLVGRQAVPRAEVDELLRLLPDEVEHLHLVGHVAAVLRLHSETSLSQEKRRTASSMTRCVRASTATSVAPRGLDRTGRPAAFLSQRRRAATP